MVPRTRWPSSRTPRDWTPGRAPAQPASSWTCLRRQPLLALAHFEAEADAGERQQHHLRPEHREAFVGRSVDHDAEDPPGRGRTDDSHHEPQAREMAACGNEAAQGDECETERERAEA